MFSPLPFRINNTNSAEGHAWRVAHGRRTTHYAPTPGVASGWTRIKSSQLSLDFFTTQGRTWTSRHIINFVFQLQKSRIIKLSAKAFNDVALKEATAWAVCKTHLHFFHPHPLSGAVHGV